jgi:tetratricopeptide (TPR) repeat protein
LEVNDNIISDLDQAIALGKPTAAAYFLRAQSKVGKWDGKPDEKPTIEMIKDVMNDLDAAIKAQPEEPAFYFYRAMFKLHDLEDQDGALRDLTNAIKLNRSDRLFRRHRAEIYLETGDYENAIRDFSVIVSAEPNASFDIRLQRAKAFRLAGEHQKALADLDLVLRRAPYFEESVLEERVKVYLALGESRRAEADERRLIRIRGQNAH